VDRGFSHRHVLALKLLRIARTRLHDAAKSGETAEITAADHYFRRCKARVDRYRLEMRT